MARLTASIKRPEDPGDADFALIVDFKKGVSSPTRVFLATADFIRAFESLDHALVKSIDSNIIPVMMLEDVEIGSLKIWLKYALRSTDDEALKSLDWKPAVGKYLVRAKYMFLRWLESDTSPRSLPDLRKEIGSLAKETDVRQLPDYSLPDAAELIEVAQQVQKVKNRLGDEDKIYIENEGEQMEIGIEIRSDIDELAKMSTKETITSPASAMILAVKKPDFLGNSKWEFRHGKRTISASIADERFLSDFQGRRRDVRPGDAIRCLVATEMSYGFDNELISESFTVVEVVEVLENAEDGAEDKGVPEEYAKNPEFGRF